MRIYNKKCNKKTYVKRSTEGRYCQVVKGPYNPNHFSALNDW